MSEEKESIIELVNLVMKDVEEFKEEMKSAVKNIAVEVGKMKGELTLHQETPDAHNPSVLAKK